MAYVELKRTGQKMPLVGFGLWKVERADCANVVYDAIKAGYRLIDGAGAYDNEKEAGEGLRRALKEGLVKREDIFITSKLWNNFHAHDHAKSVARKQLADWGIDYFDLYLVHWPVALKYVDPAQPSDWFQDDGTVALQNTPIHETWGAMEELVDEGLVKNIGISNFQGSLILDIFRYARIEPQVHQVELHPYLAQEPLLKLMKALGIAVTAYSSFGPQSYLELGWHKNVPSLLEHDVVRSIAQAKGKTTAQVLLRWATQKKIAVVPKSIKLERIISNLQCGSFDLSEVDMKQLGALDVGLRLNNIADFDPRLGIFC